MTDLRPAKELPYRVGAMPLISPFEPSGDDPFSQISPILSQDPNALTPLRAHYLKRELVTLQLQAELESLAHPDCLAVLGPPFAPSKPGGTAPIRDARDVDLPFTRFLLHHFVLTFPMLAPVQPTFYKDKLQPAVSSFLSRNISTSDERDHPTKRRRLTGKLEKHLGLIMSASIKLSDNNGQEDVVRVTGVAAASAAAGPDKDKDLPPVPIQQADRDARFQVNVVTIRTIVTKGRLRSSSHQEFIIRVRRKNMPDSFVSRRYGDYYKLAEQLRKDFPEEDVRPPPAKDRRETEAKLGTQSPDLPSTPPSGSSYDPSLPPSSPMPTLARERNRLTLRAYLRHLLSHPAIASSDTLQTFLLSQPTQLSAQEQRDVLAREEMDRVREEEATRFREQVEERVRQLDSYLRAFKTELVKKGANAVALPSIASLTTSQTA